MDVTSGTLIAFVRGVKALALCAAIVFSTAEAFPCSPQTTTFVPAQLLDVRAFSDEANTQRFTVHALFFGGEDVSITPILKVTADTNVVVPSPTRTSLGAQTRFTWTLEIDSTKSLEISSAEVFGTRTIDLRLASPAPTSVVLGEPSFRRQQISVDECTSFAAPEAGLCGRRCLSYRHVRDDIELSVQRTVDPPELTLLMVTELVLASDKETLLAQTNARNDGTSTSAMRTLEGTSQWSATESLCSRSRWISYDGVLQESDWLCGTAETLPARPRPGCGATQPSLALFVAMAILLRRRSMRNQVFVAAFCLIVVGGCDSRCSLENCTILAQKCALEPSGMPSLSVCEDKVGSPPSGFNKTKYCPAACNATNAGRVTACIVDLANKNQCGDFESCMSGFPSTSIDESCVTKCEAARRDCEAKCPATTFDACMDCAATCALTESTCSNSCRKS